MRVALVHDYINQLGGAERVFQEIARLFPDAPIYTIAADPPIARTLFPGRTIHTSFLDRFPGARRHHYYALWLMPLAIEQFDFSEYDLVISSSSSFAKGILTGPNTLHVSYVNTPLRYVWSDYYEDREHLKLPRLFGALVPRLLHYVRLWDVMASHRPDVIATNSEYSRTRIAKYYRRPATVIYPSISAERFARAHYDDTSSRAHYYLAIGRLTAYKRFDTAIAAANMLGIPLWIAGDGPDRKRLSRLAGPTVRFLGSVSEADLPLLYANAEAVVFPQEEHFGLVAPEAMAAGTPVIAFRAGGAVETVTEGTSGVFFDEQSPEALAATLATFRRSDFDAASVRASAARFSPEAFRTNFMQFVDSAYAHRR